jgi:hypothetical protein
VTPAAPQAGANNDAGGSSPDEALADAAEETRTASTPDAPAEEVAVSDDEAGAHKK